MNAATLYPSRSVSPSLRQALLAASLLWGTAASATEPVAPVADNPAPVEAAPVAPPDAQEPIDVVEARSELKRAETEAQQLRRELAELRSEIRQIRPHAERRGGERVGYGQVVRVEEGQEVDEVVGFGDDVHVLGHVRGDATAFGGSVIVHPTGVVRGDAVAFGGDVRIHDGGRIEGGRVSLGVPGVALEEPGSPALGAVGALASDAQGLLAMLYRRLVLMLSFAGAGVLVVGLFPSRVGRISTTLEQRPFRSLFVGAMATGFLALFSLVFAVITLGLGLPVSLMVVAVLGLAWLMGFVGLCQALGDRLPFEQKPHGRWLAFLIGTILITCVGSLPLIGWLAVLGASTIGIGAALSSRFGAA